MEGLIYASALSYWASCLFIVLLTTQMQDSVASRLLVGSSLFIVMSVPVLLVAAMWWMMGVFAYG